MMNENHDAKTGEFSSGGGSAADAHARMDQLSKRADGTYDRYGRNPNRGFMVGGAVEKGARYEGVWTDPKTGTTYTEKSNRVSSQALAKSLGRRRNQIAVWDLGKGREVNTGGSGAYTPSRGYRFKLAGTRH